MDRSRGCHLGRDRGHGGRCGTGTKRAVWGAGRRRGRDNDDQGKRLQGRRRPVLWSFLGTCNANRPTQTWSPSSCLQGNPLCLFCTSPKVTGMWANHIPVRVHQHLPAPETELSTGSHGDTAVTWWRFLGTLCTEPCSDCGPNWQTQPFQRF